MTFLVNAILQTLCVNARALERWPAVSKRRRVQKDLSFCEHAAAGRTARRNCAEAFAECPARQLNRKGKTSRSPDGFIRLMLPHFDHIVASRRAAADVEKVLTAARDAIEKPPACETNT